MVTAMRSAPGVDRSLGIQIDELSNVWDRVNRLSEVREARLHEALKLVRRFSCRLLPLPVRVSRQNYLCSLSGCTARKMEEMNESCRS